MKKKIISIGLSTSILMSGMAFATEVEKVELKDNDTAILISQKIEAESNYKNYSGKVIEVIKGTDNTTVTVKSDDKDASFDTIKFNLSKDAFILTDKTQGEIKVEKIAEGMTVEVFYDKDAAMTKSLPPITNASVLVVRESEEKLPLGVKVDTFNKSTENNGRLVSIDNSLALNITKETIIVDKEEKKLTEEDLNARDLLVFYGPATTMSIPAQSNAVKIIVLAEQEKVELPETPEKPAEVITEIKSLDKISLNGKQVTLKNKMYKSGETVMIPVREVAQNLGYKVSWNGKTKQAELVKGTNFITATSNQDMYSFAKMIVKLGKASDVKAGIMFVPVDFIKEVMKLDMEITKEGIVNIK